MGAGDNGFHFICAIDAVADNNGYQSWYGTVGYYYERSNSIIASGTPSDLKQVERLIKDMAPALSKIRNYVKLPFPP